MGNKRQIEGEQRPYSHLRELRNKVGWTQKEVALALGVGVQSVSNWERGISIPLKHCDNLCEILQTTREQLAYPDIVKAIHKLNEKYKIRIVGQLLDYPTHSIASEILGDFNGIRK